jgi:hypothetical protein
VICKGAAGSPGYTRCELCVCVCVCVCVEGGGRRGGGTRTGRTTTCKGAAPAAPADGQRCAQGAPLCTTLERAKPCSIPTQCTLPLLATAGPCLPMCTLPAACIDRALGLLDLNLHPSSLHRDQPTPELILWPWRAAGLASAIGARLRAPKCTHNRAVGFAGVAAATGRPPSPINTAVTGGKLVCDGNGMKA